ncbi:hypothetical protein L4174_023895 (plasmid) [Photobacterium sp. CCB-ST2H9]|uniref:hypothetical protein n=1 Tax=Photobacterium sp. CCB-ST2H9 TaxID=2912855 RepID=UPI002004B95D|nr:hypothetical protein [Photobacterium sp. CCB-ST2H9]UTM60430.1 hypothetical protein L4174_023895 [Photobacterium sp. CCB-ST2H9]
MSANETINDTLEKIEEASAKHRDIIQQNLSGFISELFPLSNELMNSINATESDATIHCAATNVLSELFSTFETAMSERGINMNPYTMASIVAESFIIFAQNHYEPSDEANQLPDISELLFSMAHGRVKGHC